MSIQTIGLLSAGLVIAMAKPEARSGVSLLLVFLNDMKQYPFLIYFFALTQKSNKKGQGKHHRSAVLPGSAQRLRKVERCLQAAWR